MWIQLCEIGKRLSVAAKDLLTAALAGDTAWDLVIDESKNAQKGRWQTCCQRSFQNGLAL